MGIIGHRANCRQALAERQIGPRAEHKAAPAANRIRRVRQAALECRRLGLMQQQVRDARHALHNTLRIETLRRGQRRRRQRRENRTQQPRLA